LLPVTEGEQHPLKCTTIDTRDVNLYPGSRDPNLLPELGQLSTQTYPIPMANT